jgi:hypothetical protein
MFAWRLVLATCVVLQLFALLAVEDVSSNVCALHIPWLAAGAIGSRTAAPRFDGHRERDGQTPPLTCLRRPAGALPVRSRPVRVHAAPFTLTFFFSTPKLKTFSKFFIKSNFNVYI